MKEQQKKLIYCICCLQITDPEKEKEVWVNEEQYRYENYDDPRLIDGGITRIDYCDACKKKFKSDVDFSSDSG